MSYTGIHHSSHSGEDPTVPTSEPSSRLDWLSLDAQLQSKQPEAADAGNAHDGLDLQYIFSKRSEPQSSAISKSYISAIPLGQGASTTLPYEDSFLRTARAHRGDINAPPYYLSFQLEKVEGKGYPSRGHEMWRCGKLGRFKVDRLILPKRAFGLYLSLHPSMLTVYLLSLTQNFVCMNSTTHQP